MLIKKFFEKMPKNKKFDLSILLQNISKKNKLSGYIVKKDFTKLDPIKE